MSVDLQVRVQTIFKTPTWRKKHVILSCNDNAIYLCKHAADAAAKVFESQIALDDAHNVM